MFRAVRLRHGRHPSPWIHPPQPLRPDEEQLWALLCHLSYFVLGIIAPLVIMLTLGTRSAYVRHHAVEALNFQITVALAAIASGLLIIVLVGILLLPLVVITGLVFAIVAAVQAHQGQLYRYPLSIRLVN
jgi:uncharacterized Tic20 family protein